MQQVTAPQINKDRVQEPCGNDRDDAKERGPLKLFGAREDDGRDVRAELEGILPSRFDRGEGSPMSGFDVLYAVWIGKSGRPDKGNRARAKMGK